MYDWSEYSSSGMLWGLIEEKLEALCIAWGNGRFVPLLEADVAAYLYHLLVSHFDGDGSYLHLETRIRGGTDGEKPDLAIGPIESDDQKHELYQEFLKETKRKASKPRFNSEVIATMILEFKHCRKGITFKSKVEDPIIKLGRLKKTCPEGRGLILFLDNKVPTSERDLREKIISARGPDDRDLRIYICRKKEPDQQPWTLL